MIHILILDSYNISDDTYDIVNAVLHVNNVKDPIAYPLESLYCYTNQNDKIFALSTLNAFATLGEKYKNMLINANVNSSLNILRKYLNVASEQIISEGCRGLVVRPYRISFY